MKNNFDIKKFLIENKITLNSKNISEQDNFTLSDEDLELAKGFNVTYLTIGDTITPDMWESDGGGFIPTKNPLYIKDVDQDEEGWYIEFKNYAPYDLDEINDYLKPEYQVFLSLDESFELSDDDLELAKKFNGEIWDGGTIDEYEEWAEPILINAGFKENDIQDYMMDVANTGIEEYENITSKELLDDFKNWKYDESVFDDEDEDLDESFELGNEDFELAKGLNIVYLKEGDIVTPDMWDEKKCNDMGINYSYLTRESWTIESFDHINEPQIGEVFWLVVLKGNSSGMIDDDMEEDVANEILKDNYRFDIPLDAPDTVNEEFELGPNDMELAKGLDYDPQYDLVLEIAESYDDEELLQDFLNTFPVGEHINKEEFYDFFAKYVDDYGDWFYIKQNWKYVESGGDESVYDELNEEFTLDTTDTNDKI